LKETARKGDGIELSWDYIPKDFEMRGASITPQQWADLHDDAKSQLGGQKFVTVNEAGATRSVPVRIETPSDRLNTVRRVVREKQFQELRFFYKGEIHEQTLDLFSGNSILQMYNALNRENRRKWFRMSWAGVLAIYIELLG